MDGLALGEQVRVGPGGRLLGRQPLQGARVGAGGVRQRHLQTVQEEIGLTFVGKKRNISRYSLPSLLFVVVRQRHLHLGADVARLGHGELQLLAAGLILHALDVQVAIVQQLKIIHSQISPLKRKFLSATYQLTSFLAFLSTFSRVSVADPSNTLRSKSKSRFRATSVTFTSSEREKNHCLHKLPPQLARLHFLSYIAAAAATVAAATVAASLTDVSV